MKGAARRLAGVLGGLFIAAPIMMVCSIVGIAVSIISPSKGAAIFRFALDCCEPFADLMAS